ncbi:hypothetical protein SCP_0409670 [Sparassis crispa]|uniref:HCP-like protein n=1 Tax=Sparassis crispa TaxID=139825 RepID=A0A401GK93_9APHY|nr:hypothetical protein SCP_0409670 [Sparassis crispa]GBE82583.1 hypothetical protein SCP_0409670 [Sparassis crispa]
MSSLAFVNSPYHQDYPVPPSLAQSPPDQQDDTVSPLPPPYDSADILQGFENMRIGDPTVRGNSAPSFHPGEPLPRAGTSMSVRSAQSPPRLASHQPLPLPISPEQAAQRAGMRRSTDPALGFDGSSIHSGGSGSSAYNSAYSDAPEYAPYDRSVETDGTSLYSFDDPSHRALADGYIPREDTGAFPPGRSYTPANWQDQQSYAQPPGRTDFNSFYAAASDVLGMGPPPSAPPPVAQHAVASHSSAATYFQPPPNHSAQNHLYRSTTSPSLSPSSSVPYAGPYQQAFPSMYTGASQSSLSRGQPVASPPPNSEVEIEPRPSLQRSGTTTSVNLRTQKTKAVDLSAPPYTKEYIDQYRQRVRDDPDPEVHFLYAKYLIDAAKKIGADAKDQRGMKKYRDTLIVESLKVMRRLATQGQAYDEAQFFLANCHGTGMLGLQVDHERAYHLYLQAAKQNHAAACYRVAVCNEIGAGTRREPQRALAFYRKAASLGDTAAMYKLGVIQLRGSLGEQPSPREAVAWLKRAAEQADEENPHALHELALLHEASNSQIVPYDPAYARDLYTRAGHLGYTHSQYKLGQCYEFGVLTCPVDPRRSIAWYTKAAEKGHSEAELALSGWYLTGSEGVLKQSDSEAYLWARRAANKGLSKAEYAVGYYAETGIGIKQDIEFSKRWYMRAAGKFDRNLFGQVTALMDILFSQRKATKEQ